MPTYFPLSPPAGNTQNGNLAEKQQISGKRRRYFTLTHFFVFKATNKK